MAVGNGPPPDGVRATTARRAPARAASPTNAWPSTLVPGSAKKAPPAATFRVSMAYEVMDSEGSPETSVPPAAWSSSLTLSVGTRPSAEPERFELAACVLAVVERLHVAGNGLSRFVALSGD